MSESIFDRIGKDLLKLEVNTILKDSSSLGDKMPSNFREAFYRLSRSYHFKMVKFQNAFEIDIRGKAIWIYGGLCSFEELRKRAIEGQNKFKEMINSENSKLSIYSSGKEPALSLLQKQKIEDYVLKLKHARRILQRIQFQSELIVSIFKELERNIPKDKNGQTGYQSINCGDLSEDFNTVTPSKKTEEGHLESWGWNNDIPLASIQRVGDLPLAPNQILRLRKAWDLGTEEIVMQTIIDIEGDVTSRIMRSFALSPDKTVLEIHNQAIHIATGMWKSLVQTVASMANKAFEQLLGR